MSDVVDSTLPRRQLGRYLREGREAMGLTIVEAAALLQWGKSTLHRLERGQSDRVRIVDIRELCTIYGFDEPMTTAMLGLAQQAAVKSWWHEFGDLIPENFSVYMGLEASARRLTTFQPDLVPGLLQTFDYAWVLFQNVYPEANDAEISARVKVRMTRQALITRSAQPTSLQVLLGETVVRRMIGSRTVMAAQLRSLADSTARPNITIRVVPFSAGMPTGEQTGPFVILGFDSDGKGKSVDPTVVYAEGFTGDMYSEKTHIVERYAAAFDRMRNAAFDEAESRSLLRQAAKEYAT
ncbi:helix-turn-helix domain-containing protein [Nocardia sp. NBC_01503]|uniref:helix-turn-helix domain-containing protein n=1 Tax=Nocardia sp. NBC_01503 TaxID=2975997 RepID=UPI002E7C43E1|nr:helix-turn-helix transcriptional regulator [Nocardia sp. NBC_01503]WTL29982.1 helix-turn-helix domain-containing protein [Nocardia sp. NBC_01503]